MPNNETGQRQNELLNNIEQFRKSYELPHIWQLRKEFLKIYADQFESDRLVCLSNVFVNVECMGLTYPDEVMKSIKELGSKVTGLELYRHQLEKDEPEFPRKQPNQQQQSQYQQQQPQYQQRQQQNPQQSQYQHRQQNNQQQNRGNYQSHRQRQRW